MEAIWKNMWVVAEGDLFRPENRLTIVPNRVCHAIVVWQSLAGHVSGVGNLCVVWRSQGQEEVELYLLLPRLPSTVRTLVYKCRVCAPLGSMLHH